MLYTRPHIFLPRQSRLLPRALLLQSSRSLSSTPRLLARKDTQDKDSLKPESNEYSKSGSDSAAAQHSEAFDGSKTRPEEHAQGSDALNVSPANKSVSKARGGEEGGAQSSSAQSGKGPSDRSRTSGGSGGEESKKGAEGKRYQ